MIRGGDQAVGRRRPGRAPPAGSAGRPVGDALRRGGPRQGSLVFVPTTPPLWGWGGGHKNRSEYGILLTLKNKATMRG